LPGARYARLVRSAAMMVAVLALGLGGCASFARTTPSELPPCSVNSLRVYWTGHPPGDTQDVGALLVLATRSAVAEPCLLTGRPQATAQVSTGKVVGVTRYTGPFPPDDVGHVALTPRNPAYLMFHDIEECNVVNEGPPFYVAITVWIHGQALRVAVHLPARCGLLAETPYYD
jgi:hypothetical protein